MSAEKIEASFTAGVFRKPHRFQAGTLLRDTPRKYKIQRDRRDGVVD